MKSILFLIMLTLIVSCSNNVSGPNDSNENYRVKTIEITSSKDITENYKFKYDSDLLKEIIFSYNEYPEEISVMFYNYENNLMTEMRMDPYHIYKYEYNEKLQVKKVRWSYETLEYTYNDHNLIKTIRCSGDHNSYRTYQYDEYDNCYFIKDSSNIYSGTSGSYRIEGKSFFYDNELIKTIKKDVTIFHDFENNSETITTICEFEYDDKNLVKYIDDSEIRSYKYDHKNRLIEFIKIHKETEEETEKEYTYKFLYDDNNNLIQVEEKYPYYSYDIFQYVYHTTTYTYTYELGKSNNRQLYNLHSLSHSHRLVEDYKIFPEKQFFNTPF